MPSLLDLIAAAEAGELTAEFAAAAALWLRWAEAHYPLMAGIRAIAELDIVDPGLVPVG